MIKAVNEGNPRLALMTGTDKNQWCGLSDIQATDTSMWSSSTAFANVANNGTGLIWRNDATWTLGVSGGDAGAACAQTLSGQNLVAFTPVSVSPSNPTSGPLTFPAWTACFLTDVHGSFQDDSFAEGVSWTVDWSHPGEAIWTLTATGGRSAEGLCIQ
jgi:hypothetical protein